MTTEVIRPTIHSGKTVPAIDAIRNNFWGVTDQALISGTNFLVMVLLARQLGPEAFGTFVVAYTVLIFANSIQSPLFTAPHNVLGATRTGPAYSHYTTTTAIAQTIFSCAAGLVIGLAGLAALVTDHSSAGLLLALAPTCIAWQLQEFIRRVLYTHSDYKGAFLNDVIAYGGQIIGVALLIGFGHLNAVSAVVIIGLANFAGAGVGGWRIRPLLTRTLDEATVREELKENWIFGRWLLGSSLTSWVSGQLYPLLTAGFVGVAATGGLRAAQTILGPANILLRSMDAVIPSRASRVYSNGGVEALRQYVRAFGVPGGSVMIGLCIAISVVATPFVGSLLGPEYEPYAWLIPISAAVYVLSYLNTMASIILRSVGRTAPMFYTYLLSAIIVLTLGVWAVATFGLQGAVIGMIGHLLFLNVVLWREVRLTLRSPTE